jgi:hypothetical protein
MEVMGLGTWRCSILARQAWNLLTNPNTISGLIWKEIYYPNEDILSAELGSRPSKIWRAISEGRDALRVGLVERIGTGEQPITVIKESPPVWVSQLIDHSSRSWNLRQLNAVFLPLDVEIIHSIPLGTVSHGDFWAWQFEKHGNFWVKSTYRMLTKTKNEREAWLEERPSSSGCNDQKHWTSLWKTKVPSNIRVFLWRLSHQSLPTGTVLYRRLMSDDSSCGLCHAPNDSWRHSLLECNMASSTWALIDEDTVVQRNGRNGCSS